MARQIQNRRGTAADWTSSNPVLAQGEFGFETDTSKFKIGDGVTAWASLGYFSNDASIVSTINSSISSHAGNATAHHSNTNDPTSGQKAALAGSSGTPSDANRYVTNDDSRMTNARTPVSHNNSAHSETYITTSGVTYEALNANSDVGTTSGTLCAGDDARLVTNAKQADRPFVFQTGHTAWATGLSNEEIGRIQLQTGETLYIKRVEIQIKGGGTSSSLSVNAYDSTNTTTIASQTAGGVNTTGGNSGSAALVLIRLTNSVGSTQSASVYISGWIRS